MAVQQKTSGDFIFLQKHIKSCVVFILIHCLPDHILTLQVSRYQSNSLCFIWYHLHPTDCIHGKLKSPSTRAVPGCHHSNRSIKAMSCKVSGCIFHDYARPISCNWYVLLSIWTGLWTLIPRMTKIQLQPVIS